MELFDQLNFYLNTHPGMLEQLAFAIQIKYWILLALALYFILLPYRHSKKKSARAADDKNQFLA